MERSLFTHPPVGGYLGGSHFSVVLPLCTSLCVHAGWDAHRESGRGSLRQLYVSHFEEPPSCPLNRLHRFPRPPAAGEGPDFSTPLPALVVICPFYLRRPSGNGVVSCCGSGFLFPAKFSLNAFRVLISCVSLLQGAVSLEAAGSPEKSETHTGRTCLLRAGGDVLGGLRRRGTPCLLSGDQTEGHRRSSPGQRGRLYYNPVTVVERGLDAWAAVTSVSEGTARRTC